MRQTGTVKVWKDEKGYGFITPDGGGADVFFHISSVGNRTRRPAAGDPVEFRRSTGNDGKPRAEGVRITGADATPARAVNPFPYILMAFCIGMSIYCFVKTGFPVGLTYPLLGVMTYAAYAQDKEQAQSGGQRTPEAVLHLLELLGGWCGGYLAQQRFRHKTVKESYQFVFWTIALLHGIAWGMWAGMNQPR